MFNALNRFISRLDAESPQQKSEYGAFGFQVLRNNNLELGIEPWFDFIVGINGRMIDDSTPALFAQEVRNCAGSSVTLGLWSAKGQRTRTLQIPISPSSPSLGLTLQWASLSTVSNIWHILDVPANSPADIAGLLPYSDYILGTPEGLLHGEAGLGELVEDHIGRPLRLYVYNNEYNVTREVTIHPSREWGGEGALGCVLGYGALHRLPAPLSEPVAEPGSTLFEHSGESAHFSNEEARPGSAMAYDSSTGAGAASHMFVPAETAAANDSSEFLIPAQLAPPPMRGPPTGGKKKRAGHSPNKMMDEYFNEGEKKSRELDFAPSAKSTPPPPPPKAGGPPMGGPPVATKSPEGKTEEEDGSGVD